MTSMQDRMDLRKKNFKKGVDADESRRKREDETVQIRKQKRDEQLSKKRMVNPDEEEVGSENVPAFNNNVPDELGLGNMVAQLQTAGAEQRLAITTDLRRLVSRTKQAPIQQSIDAGFVPLMIRYCTMTDDPKLQFEAAWVLTNIASGTSSQTQAVVDNGAVPVFLELLRNGEPDTQEQVVWAIANIAGDSAKYRNMVLEQDPITPMCKLLVKHEGRITMLRNVTWAISNLCRGKPAPELRYIQMALPFLARLIMCNDTDVLSDALWAFSYICDGEQQQIDAVIQSGAVAKLVEHMMNPNESILQPALRACGNIATGSDMQTSILLQNKVLQTLPALLAKPKKLIRKEALWLISNVTAGTAEQIQMVLEAGLFESAVQLAIEGQQEVRKEAVWVLANAAMSAQEAQIDYMTKCGAVQSLCTTLAGSHDPGTVKCALDALDRFFMAGERRREREGGENIYCHIVEECKGLDKLEDLQEDANKDIYDKAVHLIQTYFTTEEEAETEEETQPTMFNFGA